MEYAVNAFLFEYKFIYEINLGTFKKDFIKKDWNILILQILVYSNNTWVFNWMTLVNIGIAFQHRETIQNAY